MSALSSFLEFTNTLRKDLILDRVLKNFRWNLANALFVQFIALIISLLLARIFSIEDFGEYTIIRSTYIFIVSIFGSAFSIALTRHVAQYRDSDPGKISRIITLILSITFFVSLSFLIVLHYHPETVIFFLKDIKTSLLFKSGFLWVIFSLFNMIFNSILSGLEKYRTIFLVSFIENIFLMITVIVLSKYFGVYGALIGFFITTIPFLLYRYYVVNNLYHEFGIKIFASNFISEFPTLSKVALPASLMALSVAPCEWFMRLILSHQPNGLSSLAILAVAQSISQIVTIIPMQISNSSISVLSNLFSNREFNNFKKLLITNAKILLLVSMVSAIPIMILSKFIMSLYGSKFEAGSTVLVIYTLTYAFASITMIFGEALTASDNSWVLCKQKFIWSAFTMISAFFLVQRGELGIAFAYLLGNIFLIFIQLFSIFKLIKKLDKNK